MYIYLIYSKAVCNTIPWEGASDDSGAGVNAVHYYSTDKGTVRTDNKIWLLYNPNQLSTFTTCKPGFES
jgi:hypothetical protein